MIGSIKEPRKKPKHKKLPKRYKLSVERKEALHELQRYKVEKTMTPNGFNRCVTCGCITDIAQGGHYIGRECRATELEEDNINPQCPSCNYYGKGGGAGEQLLHGKWIAENLGLETKQRLDDMFFAWKGSDEAFERLSPEDQYKVTHQKTADEYHEIRMKYKQLRKQLKMDRGW